MKKLSVWTAILACLTTAIVVFGVTVLWLRPRPEVVPVDRAGDKLAEAAEVIRNNFIGDYEESAMTDAAIDAMVASLDDRWSYYMTAEEMAAYLNSQNNQYGGIGIVLREVDGSAMVYKVYAHSAAGEAGVPVGSRFLTVGEEDVSGQGVDPVASRIRADIAQGLVRLTVLSPEGERLSFELVPGEVYTEPVSSRVLPSGLGYVRVENFEGRSAGEAIAAVEELLNRQVPGIIFDMRQNPGGLLSELLQLLDYLLPEGKLFISRHMDGSEEVDTSDAACVELPMAVLVDGDTYSAAEFFAAALREYGWARLVGTQTSGKGYAQITVPLSDGSAIHISHMAYFTPSGVSLAGVGLTPDVVVELGEEERSELYYSLLEDEEDTQLRAAEALLLEKVPSSP